MQSVVNASANMLRCACKVVHAECIPAMPAFRFSTSPWWLVTVRPFRQHCMMCSWTNTVDQGHLSALPYALGHRGVHNWRRHWFWRCSARALVEGAAWKEVSKGSQNAGACRVLHAKGIVIAELQERAVVVYFFANTRMRICAHMHIPMVACMCRLFGHLQEGWVVEEAQGCAQVAGAIPSCHPHLGGWQSFAQPGMDFKVCLQIEVCLQYWVLRRLLLIWVKRRWYI